MPEKTEDLDLSSLPFMLTLMLAIEPDVREKPRREAIRTFEETIDEVITAFRESATEAFEKWYDEDFDSFSPDE